MANACSKLGTIKWYDRERKFGFIIPAERKSNEEVFLHWGALEASGVRPERLQRGMQVYYADEAPPRPGDNPQVTHLKLA
jgi:cold shock CspA family protein